MKNRKNEKLSDTQTSLLRQLPKIDTLIKHEKVTLLLKKYSHETVVRGLRHLVESLREGILTHRITSEKEIQLEVVAGSLEEFLERDVVGDLRRCINGTGVVIHTNLGRAPLCEGALKKLNEIARGYCNLEYEVEERRRGGRMAGVKDLLCELTGAESAYVVNNNAAAVMLGLGTIAKGREVIISRSELVEIGGSFRVPDVMRASGVILKEVGTTNRTHLRDYENAITPKTGLLLKVHQSNYVIRGFTKEVSLDELIALGKKYDIPVMVDLGSGSLFDVGLKESRREPLVQEFMKSGVDLLTFSGDKLLGGPQAGILIGRKKWVEKASKEPITRALRVDKLTLGALEATLHVYTQGEDTIRREIPVISMLTRDFEELQERAQSLLQRLQGLRRLTLSLEKANAAVGGGALPDVKLPTIRLVIQPKTASVERLDEYLRSRKIPIIGLLDRGRFLLDLRSILECDISELLNALQDADAFLAASLSSFSE